ncbi:MAG: hypothetical protein JWQ45_3263 [Blastococcus sp.]|nr:hypothetical protein [Blastococcus sp.]
MSAADHSGTDPTGDREDDPSKRAPAAEVHTGRPPTPDERYWAAAGEELTPLKSLERIDSKAGFVFGNVTLVGTILTGFGLATGTSGRFADHPGPASTALALIVVAVLLALAANLPSFRRRIDPADIVQVERFYRTNIGIRGWLTRVALLCFTGALLLAAWLVSQVASAAPETSLALQWRDDGEGARNVVGRVVATDLPPAAEMETVLVSQVSDDEEEQVLAEDHSDADGTGSVTVTVEVGAAPADTVLRLEVVVTRGGERVAADSMELTP